MQERRKSKVNMTKGGERRAGLGGAAKCGDWSPE